MSVMYSPAQVDGACSVPVTPAATADAVGVPPVAKP